MLNKADKLLTHFTMKKKVLFLVNLLIGFWLIGSAQTPKFHWPDSVYTGKQGKFHVQGMTIDTVNQWIYFSFTNKLIKTDFKGNLIGSVVGFLGHLGDLDINPIDGRVYGSLEYKNDAIGKGITKTLGIQSTNENGFYVAIFDGSKIVRSEMDAEKEDLLRTVHLLEPVKDYEAKVKSDGKVLKHRYACSGIDGITFGPSLGDSKDGKRYLYVAYGVYGDTTRNDNDYQVILKYDVANWTKYEAHLLQGKLHRSGPKKPLAKYFLKTGSTTYGIQNLAYDSYSGNFYAAVYKGEKSIYPNFGLFVIDGSKKPVKGSIFSDGKYEKEELLSLVTGGIEDSKTGISGWHFKWGSTGLCPIGNGYFYISHNGKSPDGQQESTIYKYKWVGSAKQAFVKD